MNRAVIALGSNIDPQENIGRAKKLLVRAYHILAESQFIMTKPIGDTDQKDFINGALLLETPLAFDELKKMLKIMEVQLGRHEKTAKFGPRTIDLDIVVWNGKVVDQDFYERDYLKQAVLGLWPNLRYEKSARQPLA